MIKYGINFLPTTIFLNTFCPAICIVLLSCYVDIPPMNFLWPFYFLFLIFLPVQKSNLYMGRLQQCSKAIVRFVLGGTEKAGTRTGSHILPLVLNILKFLTNLLTFPYSQKQMNHILVLINCKLPVDFIGCRTGHIRLKCGWSVQ